MAVGKVKMKDRLIRGQVGRRMRIPGGITPEHFLKLTNILKIILGDIDVQLKALRTEEGKEIKADERPKELHIRLNESDKPFPMPLFAAWVESDDVREARQDWNHPDPGLHRFGDDVYSEIYGEAFRYANVEDKHFRHRDWEKDHKLGIRNYNEILEKRSGEKATDPKAGNRVQTCLAMVIDDYVIGTLVVGFRHRPDKPLLDKTEEVLGKWARDASKSSKRYGLIKFLIVDNKFELGGPRLEKSDWVGLNYK